MLVEMKSPAFKECGKEDGAMSIGKTSTLLAIDFVFGGSTYIKSDGVKKEGHHTIFFTFEFNGVPYYFARNTGEADTVFICDKNYEFTGNSYTKTEFVEWLKQQYEIDFVGLSFRTVLSSFLEYMERKIQMSSILCRVFPDKVWKNQ